MINRRQALKGFFVSAVASASAAVLYNTAPLFDNEVVDDTSVEFEGDMCFAKELQCTAPGKTDRLTAFVEVEKGGRLAASTPLYTPIPQPKPVIDMPAIAELPANVPLPARRPADLIPAQPKAKQAAPEKHVAADPGTKQTFTGHAKPDRPKLETPSIIRPGYGSVKFYNLHTAERLTVDFRSVDTQSFDHFMRDFRRKEVKHIDERLVQRYARVVQTLRTGGADVDQVNLISGYRSPQTNAMLQKTRGGQASNSQHIYGRAMDTQMPGVSLSALHKAACRVATSEGSGGVGYYPSSNFVHIDVARLRFWG
jgi:uncharacterized protein YcbK (DUF882 family)